jgi:hypothetical protein
VAAPELAEERRRDRRIPAPASTVSGCIHPASSPGNRSKLNPPACGDVPTTARLAGSQARQNRGAVVLANGSPLRCNARRDQRGTEVAFLRLEHHARKDFAQLSMQLGFPLG